MSWSPVVVAVAGFHGNTDPIMVLLCVASMWFVLERRSGFWSGLAVGLAVSVKVVPVVLLPVLAVACWRLGPSAFRRFVGGGSIAGVVLWTPVLMAHHGEFTRNVLGYAGGAPPQWGLTELAVMLGASWSGASEAGEGTRYLAVLIAAMVPAVLAARVAQPAHLQVLVALPLPIFLTLSTAFGMQYLTWAVAPLLIAVPVRAAVTYVLTASTFALAVYSYWCSAPPWRWDVGEALPLPAVLAPLMLLTWLCLAGCCAQALARTAPGRVLVSSA